MYVRTVKELKKALDDMPEDAYLATSEVSHRGFYLNREYSEDYMHETVELNFEREFKQDFVQMIRKDMLKKLELSEEPSLVELIDAATYSYDKFIQEIRKHCDNYLVGGKLMNAYDIIGKYRIDMGVLKQIATPSNTMSVSEDLLKKLSE